MLQATSFELSKQLFEVAKSKGVELPVSSEPSHSLEDNTTGICNFYSAYTTDELLAWLPPYSHIWQISDGMYLVDNKNLIRRVGSDFNVYDSTPSNALAKLAIYLIENDLLK
jgi:hypothetical protein